MEKIFQGLETFHKGKKGKRKDISVKSLEGEGKVLGLYFSARWCSPCRAFTPKLAEWYTTLTSGLLKDKFEIVFISSDKEEKEFDTYFDTMPWLCLPYSHRDRKTKLAKRFKVSGIPSLVLIDANTGSTITKDGRSIVMSDANGEDFPWHEDQFLDIIPGDFINRNGDCISWDEFKEKEIIGLYFSAYWCPPCRTFTPPLVEFCDKIRVSKSDFDILFISSDRDDKSFQDYLSEIPFYAVPFGDGRTKKLGQLFDVTSIPTLVILNPKTGEVITDNGRSRVVMDPDGEEFPWHAKPVEQLHEGIVDTVNNRPAMVWFTDGSTEQIDQAKAALSSIATPYFEEHKHSREDSVCFIYASDNELAANLREEILKLPEVYPRLVIVDIPNQTKYICESHLDSHTIKDFLKQYEQGTLKGQSLKLQL